MSALHSLPPSTETMAERVAATYSQQLLNASPTYARARSLGNRHGAVVPTADDRPWSGFAVLLFGGAVFFALLIGGLSLVWVL